MDGVPARAQDPDSLGKASVRVAGVDRLAHGLTARRRCTRRADQTCGQGKRGRVQIGERIRSLERGQVRAEGEGEKELEESVGKAQLVTHGTATWFCGSFPGEAFKRRVYSAQIP